MRPLHLRIQGIGPFAGEENIPFDRLGDGGLYLITGDTGAGKTTIFDAICFALFGEASGDVRESSTFRSDYALPEQESQVTFSFQQNGKDYTVTRNPAYLRPRLRGQGTTLQTAGARLMLPDGTMVEGEREVTRQVEEILGLDRSQFKQTAMIAQGEFLKLLLADTKKRSEIFRRIFGTGLYSSLQERLRQEAAGWKRRCEETEQSIRQYIEGIQTVPEDEVCPQTAQLRQIANSGSLDEARKLPEILTEWLAQRKERLAELEKEEESLEQTVRAVTEALTHVVQENRQREQLAAEQEHYARYRKQEAAQQQEQQYLDRCGRVEAVCLPVWQRKTQAEKQLARQMEQMRDKEEKKQRLEEQMPVLKAAWEESRKEEASRQELRENLTRRQAELPGRRETLAQWLRLTKELAQAEKTDRENRERYQKAETEYRCRSEHFETLQLTFLRQQAGVLAAQLEPGKPCPVCGALEHPAPASVSCGAVEETQVQAARQAREEALETLQKLGLVMKEQQTIATQLVDRCRETELQLDGWDGDRLAAEEADIVRSGRLLRQQEQKAGECARAYEECEKQILPLTGELENQARQVQDAKEAVREAQAGWEDCLRREKISGEEEYRSFLLTPAERDRRIKACREYREQGVKLEGRIQKLREVIEEAEQMRIQQGYGQLAGDSLIPEEGDRSDTAEPRADESDSRLLETALQNQNGKLAERRRVLEEERSSLRQRVAANEQIAGQLEKQLEKRRQQMEKWEIYADLDRTAGGGLKGQDRLALEQYVQAFYFDQIVERANRRFREMSAGRYQLGRRQEAASRRSMAGLELEVMDYYTGKRRPVGSLSGGEAFQASLSLALGLSDVVQSMAGGIRIEAMFVDEGFGSLDREAMDLAVSTLKGLAEENFLVGIISHVEELKERIEKKIVVVKGADGSHVTLSV